PCPDQPFETASEEDKAAWKAEYKKHNDAVEIYDLVDALQSCKQAPGKSVSAHVLEMKGYMDQLHALGKSYDNDMAINLINRKENPNKDQTCHHCHVAGHWKRNCPLYLKELQKNKDKVEHGAAASDFKVFKSEVELQLGKKIKALRSDRGGECLSQEFKDYLKIWYGNFLERDRISQKFSGRDNDLEDDHMDTLPSENTSEIPVELESLGSPPELNPVRRLESD
nr:zinc finger, CCHC-type [Tanacetum cinerariifolium]